MKRWIAAIGLVVVLAGCADDGVTPTLGYTLSAPTLAPSPVTNPLSGLPEAAPTLIQGQNAPTYAALPSGGELPLLPAGTADTASASVPIHVTSVDGTLLNGDLYAHVNDSNRYPAALLVNADRTAWGDFALQLRDGGFTVLSMDFRPDHAVDDLLAMVAAFGQIDVVDPSRILIIGAEDSANGVLGGCAVGVPMDALGLISPTAAPPGAAMQCSKPLLMVAAPSDSTYAVVQQIQSESRSSMTVIDATGGARGASALANDDALAAQVISWAQEQLGG